MRNSSGAAVPPARNQESGRPPLQADPAEQRIDQFHGADLAPDAAQQNRADDDQGHHIDQAMSEARLVFRSVPVIFSGTYGAASPPAINRPKQTRVKTWAASG